jgi:hypothetical protein
MSVALGPWRAAPMACALANSSCRATFSCTAGSRRGIQQSVNAEAGAHSCLRLHSHTQLGPCAGRARASLPLQQPGQLTSLPNAGACCRACRSTACCFAEYCRSRFWCWSAMSARALQASAAYSRAGQGAASAGGCRGQGLRPSGGKHAAKCPCQHSCNPASRGGQRTAQGVGVGSLRRHPLCALAVLIQGWVAAVAALEAAPAAHEAQDGRRLLHFPPHLQRANCRWCSVPSGSEMHSRVVRV